jgi:hypothetical protein
MALSELEATGDDARQKRAEYVVMKLLDTVGAIEANDLDLQIMQIHDQLCDDGTSPFSFRKGGSNGPTSKELNTAVQSLLHFKYIKNELGEYKLTQEGEDYLDDDDALKLDGIDSTFRNDVSDVVDRLA